MNLYYDNQILSAKKTLKGILEQIDRNEASSHAPFYNYARSMLEFAMRAKNEPDIVYVPLNFTPSRFSTSQCLPRLLLPPSTSSSKRGSRSRKDLIKHSTWSTQDSSHILLSKTLKKICCSNIPNIFTMLIINKYNLNLIGANNDISH